MSVTPLMSQYASIKETYPDTIFLFRTLDTLSPHVSRLVAVCTARYSADRWDRTVDDL